MEAEYGSIIRAMMKGPRRSTGLVSFADGGMQTLTDRLVERLGSRVRCGTEVQRIARSANGWRVSHGDGESSFDAVIVTTPADVTAALLDDVDATLAAQLRDIPYAPMRAVGVAFHQADVPAPLDGFGFLAARNQGVRLLGALYTSTIIPEHAPPGTAYLRILLGGASDPEIATLDPDAVLAIVLADLRKVLGITARPVVHHDVVWPQGIPQYRLQHRAVVNAIEAREAQLPGLALAGNAYRGLGVGDDVRDALAVADRLDATY
jgi:oxygen-dependent protoporphyrinogen oxidase